VYGKRLDIKNEVGEKLKIKDVLLARHDVTVIMYKGVQPKYVHKAYQLASGPAINTFDVKVRVPVEPVLHYSTSSRQEHAMFPYHSSHHLTTRDSPRISIAPVVSQATGRERQVHCGYSLPPSEMDLRRCSTDSDTQSELGVYFPSRSEVFNRYESSQGPSGAMPPEFESRRSSGRTSNASVVTRDDELNSENLAPSRSEVFNRYESSQGPSGAMPPEFESRRSSGRTSNASRDDELNSENLGIDFSHFLSSPSMPGESPGAPSDHAFSDRAFSDHASSPAPNSEVTRLLQILSDKDRVLAVKDEHIKNLEHSSEAASMRSSSLYSELVSLKRQVEAQKQVEVMHLRRLNAMEQALDGLMTKFEASRAREQYSLHLQRDRVSQMFQEF
jgi:hypothetical protein